MLRLILSFEAAVLRGYNFVLDVHFFWRCLRYSFRRSVEMARNTIH